MYFRHSSKVWQEFPQLVAGLLVLEGIHPDVDVEATLQPWYQKARERLSDELWGITERFCRRYGLEAG